MMIHAGSVQEIPSGWGEGRPGNFIQSSTSLGGPSVFLRKPCATCDYPGGGGVTDPLPPLVDTPMN